MRHRWDHWNPILLTEIQLLWLYDLKKQLRNISAEDRPQGLVIFSISVRISVRLWGRPCLSGITCKDKGVNKPKRGSKVGERSFMISLWVLTGITDSFSTTDRVCERVCRVISEQLTDGCLSFLPNVLQIIELHLKALQWAAWALTKDFCYIAHHPRVPDPLSYFSKDPKTDLSARSKTCVWLSVVMCRAVLHRFTV